MGMTTQTDINPWNFRHKFHVLGEPQMGDKNDQICFLLRSKNLDERREFFAAKGEGQTFTE